MSKLLSLLKATMSEGIQVFNYRAKTEQSRRMMPIILASLIGILMLFSASALTAQLKTNGIEYMILSVYTLVTSAIIIMEGTYKSGDLLFKPRDNDALLAMPIKKSTIVFARIIKFYIFELLYCLIFLLPAIIAYAMNAKVDATFPLVAITMLLLVPVIPIVISCVVGLISSAISTRFRKQTLLQVILSFVALFAFAAIILAMNFSSNVDEQSIVTAGDKIAKYYYPASVFVNLATNFNLGQYLLFVGINLVVVVVAVLLISRFYFQIVNRMSVVKLVKNVDTKYNFTKHSQTMAMVRKEINRYFNTPVLLMNTAIGLVMFMIAIGAICFNFDGFATSLTSSEEFPLTIEEMRSYLPGVTFAMVAFASLMTFITATMFSLEGKAFNLLKAMPISGIKVIMTKVLAAMLLIVPVTAVGSIVMCFRFQFSVIDAILVLIGVIALPLVTELIGILIDLKYARFDAENDAVVVKQSAGVMVATFLGLGMVLTTISLTFAAVFVAGQTLGLVMIDAIFVILSMFLLFVIATKGEERYLKLTV